MCSVVSDSLQPEDCSPPGPPSMELSEQEHWSGSPFPSPRDLPDPGIETSRQILYHCATWQALECVGSIQSVSMGTSSSPLWGNLGRAFLSLSHTHTHTHTPCKSQDSDVSLNYGLQSISHQIIKDGFLGACLNIT